MNEELLRAAMFRARVARRTQRQDPTGSAEIRRPDQRNLSTRRRDPRWWKPLPVVEPERPRRDIKTVACSVAMRMIKQTVSCVFDVEMSDLSAAGRGVMNVTRARQVCCYLARRLTSASLPRIGRGLGDRDHTTVLNNARRIEELRPLDVELDHKITACEQELGQ